jgi:hypothetical protein
LILEIGVPGWYDWVFPTRWINPMLRTIEIHITLARKLLTNIELGKPLHLYSQCEGSMSDGDLIARCTPIARRRPSSPILVSNFLAMVIEGKIPTAGRERLGVFGQAGVVKLLLRELAPGLVAVLGIDRAEPALVSSNSTCRSRCPCRRGSGVWARAGRPGV